MAHRWGADVILSTLATLYHPARRAARVCTFNGTADAGWLAFSVVAAITLLAGHRIACEAVTVTLARSTHISKVFCSSEIASHAFTALVASRVVPAIDALRFRNWAFSQLPTQFFYRHFIHRIRIGHGHAVVDANPSVTIAIFKTWHALTVVRGIADVQRQAFLALLPHCIIVTFRTVIELVRTSTIAMTVALALNGAVRADIAEVTTAQVGFYARTSHATLCAHGHADFLTEIVPPGGFGFISISAFAFETLLQVETLLALWRTRVVSILTLVLRWAADVMPREFRFWYRVEQRHRDIILRF